MREMRGLRSARGGVTDGPAPFFVSGSDYGRSASLRKEATHSVGAVRLDPCETLRKPPPVLVRTGRSPSLQGSKRIVGQASDREPKRRNGSFGGKALQFGIDHRAHRPVADRDGSRDCLVESVFERPREHRDHEVISQHPVRGALEIEERANLVLLVPKNVVAEKVAVDQPTRKRCVAPCFPHPELLHERRGLARDPRVRRGRDPTETNPQVGRFETSRPARGLHARHVEAAERFPDASPVFFRNRAQATLVPVYPGKQDGGLASHFTDEAPTQAAQGARRHHSAARKAGKAFGFGDGTRAILLLVEAQKDSARGEYNL